MVLSIALSVVFSVFSQSLFANLSVFLSLLVIAFFIFVSVVFDMIGVAVTTINEKTIEKYQKQKGFETATKLCHNREKVSSFCGDVVGDICSILSGAGGVSLAVSINFADPNLYFLVTCSISALIAGLTIFGKAVMKGYAVDKCEKVVMKTAQFIETSPLSYFKKFCAFVKSKCRRKKQKRQK